MKAGQFGDVAAWSFYPTKNLGALGDAGAVTTSKQDIAEFVRKMHNYGTTKNYGINSRLDPLQAAFLRAKLPYLDQWNQLREENAWTYLNNIHHYEKVTLPFPLEEEIPSWHIFAIETENRDGLREYLSRHNIETMIHYPVTPYPSSWQPVQEAEKWTRTTLSLPVAPHVTPYICKQIADLINQWMDHD